jgi:hypothetical protein
MSRAALLPLAMVLVLADLAAQGGTITGRVLVRERDNGDHSLLVEVESAKTIDRVQFTLPDRFSLRPGFVPQTWNVILDGRKVTATGEPVVRLNLRLDVKADENLLKNVTGKEVELQAGSPGSQATTRIKTKVGTLPRVRFRDDWAALAAIVLPPEVTPGAPIYVTPAEAFAEGAWLPSWQAAEEQSTALLEERVQAALRGIGASKVREAAARIDQTMGRSRLVDIGLGLHANSDAQTLTYIDPWRERLFVVRPEWNEVPASKCDAAITGGTPMIFAGQDACIQGCFGSELGGLEEAAKLLMDGSQPVVPQAASPTSIVIRIPVETTPGLHSLELKGVPGRLDIRIFQVQGSIDQNELWRGQSTTMRLRILGSDQSIPMTIINRTPETIQIEGGERQVVSSSGGPENVVTRQVRGIMKGEFSIDYSVDQPACGVR